LRYEVRPILLVASARLNVGRLGDNAMNKNRSAAERLRVVVVRAGFGRLSLAKGLARTDFAVTLIDRHSYHLFLPLLYQLASAGLSPVRVRGAIARYVTPCASCGRGWLARAGSDVERQIRATIDLRAMGKGMQSRLRARPRRIGFEDRHRDRPRRQPRGRRPCDVQKAKRLSKIAGAEPPLPPQLPEKRVSSAMGWCGLCAFRSLSIQVTALGRTSIPAMLFAR
jgi:hypothetical protein